MNFDHGALQRLSVFGYPKSELVLSFHCVFVGAR